MADVHSHAPQRLSGLLRRLGEQVDGHVSLGEIIDSFGPRAIGAVLVFLGLLNLFPWPPGGTTITGAPLLLVSAQVAFGSGRLWLPQSWKRRGIDAEVFRKGLRAILPWLERVERASRPRLGFMFGPVGDRVLGATCTLLACIIVLPIFGGNFLPAVAVTVLALSLVQRDGALAILGYAVVGTTGYVLYLAAGIIADGFWAAWYWAAARF
jgi:hypothetical protein